MSSSVFVETSSKTADSSDCASTSDSNLVVVYGKNGISFDDKGLENLIEEKKISSISVIRLTSPTPSMREEEEEVEKLEEMLRRQDIGSDKDSCNSEDERSSISEDSTENCDSSNDDENEERKGFKESDESSEESKSKQRRLPRRKARQSNIVKQKKTRRRRRERPEIVGLRLEEFYPPEDANAIIKEALKMAGLRTDKKSKSDCEFELFVIQNDHCYTPYTSPTQMKAKLAADKLEAEKHAANRKISIMQTAAGKQLLVRKRFQQNVYSKSEGALKTNVPITSFTTDKKVFVVQRVKKDVQDRKPNPEENVLNEGDDMRSFDANDADAGGNDKSEISGTECSAETDNDRDSDLDFDVNNPKGRKRKVKLFKTHKRSMSISKVFNPKSRRSYNQDDADEIPSKPNIISNVATCSPGIVPQRQKSIVKIISEPHRITIRSTPSKAVQMMGKANFLSPVIAALPPIPKKQTENKSPLNTSSTPTSVSLSPKTFVLVKGSMENKSPVQSSQTHKEIVINKQVMSSPKTKGFTDLTKLIEQTEKQKPVKIIGHPSTPKSSHTATITSVVTFSPRSAGATTLKGFMPIETAAKSQLPAQISIQTHQSSSELEAEHDKQLDLINSIVQDEMQKSNQKVDDQITNINDNIPELVKMLESTEKVLASNNAQKNINQFASDSGCDSGVTVNKNLNLASVSSSTCAHNLVGGIDITSASLLATPEGDVNDSVDLPDDILQQVVELIKDDKTLQEAVEKQVFGSSVCSDQGIVNNMVAIQNPPPLAPISQQSARIQENPPTSSKSIIQLAISNVPTSVVSTSSPTRSNAVVTTGTTVGSPMSSSGQISYQTSKTSPLVRKEPIQIVRGNGRVITLPPIEAPTTRAKRRAQAQPIANTTNTSCVGSSFNVSTATLSESSLDSSMQSNSSLTMPSCSNVVTVQDKKVADTNTRRRGSKENTSAAATTSNQRATRTQKSVAKKGGNKSNNNKSKVEHDATESEEDDDDDPNKLWCICRQPHNNRFMICCDVCEDWFHGTCVNITKAMGLEMEQKGIDWTCPKCNKKQEEKKQPKITDMLIKKTPEAHYTQSEPSPISPPISSPASVRKFASSKVLDHSIDVLNITSKTESTVQNVEATSHLNLQSGQIINLKDFSTSTGKRATIIQTASSTTPLTAGQKKIFVTSGQANLKMTSQPGTPIRAITVVKQLTPQQHYNQNIKVIKTLSPPTTSVSQSLNIATTSLSGTPTVSVCTSTSTSSPSTSSSAEGSTMCIVCKKIARPNSIYCSDDCIRKHAQNALNTLMTKTQADTSGTISTLTKSATEDKNKKKSKGLFEELLSAADRKPKVERVNVYERKSGRVITGNSAPTVTNLKKWLQDNPTFEVIQPGSTQAMDLEKKQKQRTQHSSSPTIAKSAASSPPPLKMFSSNSSGMTNKVDTSVASSPSPQMQTKTHRSIADYLKSTNTHIASSRPSTPKQLQKYPSHVSIKPEKAHKVADESKSVGKEKTLLTKRQTSTDGSSKTSNNDGEPIRLVVRRTLKEQLLLRITEETSSNFTVNAEDKQETFKVNNVPKLTEEEIDEFAKATELEMYNYFNKDTGIKYKAKYRSLVFNIKDRKNHTLFAKICGKLILPKQLVRMSPEEMASQELAQWREQENKHQLEMIKKSELDLLTCAKNYVLKTHKGEEVIEGKSSDYANVDITIPVEDVVSAINKSELPDTSSLIRKESQTHWSDADTTSLTHSHSLLSETSQSLIDDDKSKTTSSHSKERDREREKEKETDKEKEKGREKEKERDKDREKDKERSRGRDREREKRRKSKDRHHDKFRSRKKSRSHSRSRSQEKPEKRHKSSHKDEKRDREERNRVDKERVKDIRDRTEKEYHTDVNEKKPLSDTKKSAVTHVRQIGKKFQEQQKAAINPMETYNLIDQILESTKTVEEAANIISERDKDKEIGNQRRITNTPQPVQPASSTVSTCSSSADSTVVDIPINLGSVDSDQEPTSTVSIPTPPHDPYSRFIACSSPSSSFSGDNQYAIVSLWTGNMNMVDVTSFQLSLQPIVGNSTGLAKLMPKELDVVGRIGPETVWDYISKIKKSPNKEIVVIRLIPANESETAAYRILYEYLDNRNRLGVIKSVSSHIKDFYIYPLGAGKNVPNLLQPTEPVDFYNDPARPDVLIGIIVRVVVSKRTIQSSSQLLPVCTSTSSSVNKISSRSNEIDNLTPPGSPKSKKRRQSVASHKVDEIDIDAIIKAPIIAKSQKVAAASITKLNENDADEPYSPGGSSDDDVALLPVKMSKSIDHAQTAEDELKRKMEEINRQIAAQEMEIAGLLTGEQSTFGSATSSSSNVLANISIPSNLSQILASIKTSGKDRSAVPPPPPLIGSLLKSSTSSSTKLSDADEVYNPENSMMKSKNTATESNSNSTSLLAKLSEAELLSMVPDDIIITPNKSTRCEEPPPPGV